MQYIIHKDRLISLRFNLKVLLGTMAAQKNIKLKYSSIMFVVLPCTVSGERQTRLSRFTNRRKCAESRCCLKRFSGWTHRKNSVSKLMTTMKTGRAGGWNKGDDVHGSRSGGKLCFFCGYFGEIGRVSFRRSASQ